MKKSVLAVSLSALLLVVAGCSAEKESTKKDVEKEIVKDTEITEEQVQNTNNMLDYELLFPNEEIRSYAQKMIGTKAPDFEMKNLKGDTVKLSELKGKNVIIEVESTTCPACIEAQPIVDKFKELSKGEVTVLNIFPNENKEAVEGFFKTNNFKHDDTFIAGEGVNTLVQDFQVQFTPTFIFVDKAGIIQFIHVGSEFDEIVLSSMSDLAFETDLSETFNTEEVVDVDVTEQVKEAPPEKE